MKALLFALKLLVLIGFFGSASSRAALGEKPESLELNEASSDGHQKLEEKHEQYTLHIDQSASLTLREYVGNDSGLIFAVSWVGRHRPDLKPILGGYWVSFATAQSEAPKVHGTRHQILNADHLVVKRSGHARALRGMAYDPALIPQGVDIDGLR